MRMSVVPVSLSIIDCSSYTVASGEMSKARDLWLSRTRTKTCIVGVSTICSAGDGDEESECIARHRSEAGRGGEACVRGCGEWRGGSGGGGGGAICTVILSVVSESGGALCDIDESSDGRCVSQSAASLSPDARGAIDSQKGGVGPSGLGQ